MFELKNLIFMSEYEGDGDNKKIGSLYFRTEKMNEVYRTRIRLIHKYGPEINVSKNALCSWNLGDEAWFEESLNGTCYGDLVKDKKGLLRNANKKQVYEKYMDKLRNGVKHCSRGKMLIEPNKITQMQIDEICKIIKRYTDNTGKCKNNEINNANRELSNYLSQEKILGYSI